MTTMPRIGSAGTHTPSECIRVIVVIVVNPRQVFRCLAVSMLEASWVGGERRPVPSEPVMPAAHSASSMTRSCEVDWRSGNPFACDGREQT